MVDAYTLKPLQGTSVTIADTDTTLIADSTGNCIFTGIPIRHNPLLNRLVPTPYGECTVIAVLAGYRPSVILHAEVEKGRMRNGPTVYMFPEDTDDIPAAVITETPNEQWISQLIEKYY